MTDKTVFWPSMAGACSREIAAWLEDPNANSPEPKMIPFLRDGHHLQTGVEKFLREFCQKKQYRFTYPFSWQREEPRGSYELEDLEFRCKVDGIFRKAGTILEVKCVKEKQYKKILDCEDWREIYPNYQYSAQIYLAVPTYSLKISQGIQGFSGPFNQVVFIFKNRNTSEMIGGVPFKHPAYTYREDMVEERDSSLLEKIIEKHRKILGAVGDSMPLECDSPSKYCFFCGPGSKKAHKVSTKGFSDGGVWEGISV